LTAALQAVVASHGTKDAAKEMWTLVIAALEAEPSVSDGEELVDHYHAMGTRSADDHGLSLRAFAPVGRLPVGGQELVDA